MGTGINQRDPAHAVCVARAVHALRARGGDGKRGGPITAIGGTCGVKAVRSKEESYAATMVVAMRNVLDHER